MNRLLIAQGLDYQTIERGIDGIDLEELERHFKTGKIKFFYTIPRFHYPLGHSYSEQDKRAILDLAAKYGVYIVEDDYLGEFGLQEGPDPSTIWIQRSASFISSPSQPASFQPCGLRHSFCQMLSLQAVITSK